MTDHPVKRRAIITHDVELDRVQRYLPSNYQAAEKVVLDPYNAEVPLSKQIVIFGYDNAGWTLDNYVIPRLASGMIFATETPNKRDHYLDEIFYNDQGDELCDYAGCQETEFYPNDDSPFCEYHYLHEDDHNCVGDEVCYPWSAPVVANRDR